MILQDLEKFNLPDSPGVYFFKNEEEILYIGKATSLKDRVKSYFSNDILKTRGLHIGNMTTIANRVDFQKTRSVLEALLLENELIKKHKPIFNTKEKDDKSYFAIVISKEDFPRVLLVRNRNILQISPTQPSPQGRATAINILEGIGPVLQFTKYKNEQVEIDKVFGPYPSGEHAKEALKVIRKIFPFRDKCEVFDKKKSWQKKPCFSYQIGLCPGSCAGVISKLEYKKQINRLVQFLEGDSDKLRLNLEKEMQGYSKDLKFEEAQKIKEMLFALDHIRDAHLIHRDRNENDMRIEAYDISHISGTNRVGAMTVVLNGLVAKHEYKKFKISTDKNDDLEGLRELLERRFKHLEWGIPDIIVLDGDERHMRVAEKIFQNTKIVAVTKDKKHKAKSIIGNNNINKEEIENYKKEIILANSEVHRFALNYHRNLRSSGLNKSLKVK